jgi:hypothetical protein
MEGLKVLTVSTFDAFKNVASQMLMAIKHKQKNKGLLISNKLCGIFLRHRYGWYYHRYMTAILISIIAIIYFYFDKLKRI